MPLLWALATGTLLIFFCTHLQVFGSGSLRVFLTTPHQNCTWLPVESSLVTFELAQNSSSAGPQPDAAACSVLLTPDPQFGQRAENFVFRIVNRHLVCRLSIQIDDLVNNKSLSVCSWPREIFQTSLSVRLLSQAEPSAEPAEFQQHSNSLKADPLLLTAAAFY
uniref:Uroplakin-3b n=1 Tax=Macrostomum lignano TaxID=282301 RepID=A0A1I8IJP0_9PLAT